MWSTGINRNIVECKAGLQNSLKNVNSVLIETLWNVKVELYGAPEEDDIVLIETLWNVKGADGFLDGSEAITY